MGHGRRLFVIASEAKQSMERQSKSGLLRRGACRRARIRATRRLLAMTACCAGAPHPPTSSPDERFALTEGARSGARLEGWPRARAGPSWFETREDALLTMR